MNYYLKYLKYKQKYLDLKNLNGLNNYKDLEGGVLGFRDIDDRMTPYYHFDANIERLAYYWHATIGPVSYQRGYNRENNYHLGYFLMFNYKRPKYDDRDNHIHIYESFETDDTFGFNYSLKISKRHMYLNRNEIRNIIRDTLSFNTNNWKTTVRTMLQDNINTNPNFYIRTGRLINNTVVIDKYDNNGTVKTPENMVYECGFMFSQIAKIADILKDIRTGQILPTT